MNERDELTRILNDNITDDIAIRPLRCDIRAQVEQATNALLAAGYRKPHTITTAEELDALPVATVARTRVGEVISKRSDAGAEFQSWWAMAGTSEYFESREFAFPATVLWEPK